MAEVLNQEQVLVNEDTLTTMADSIRLKLGEETNPQAVGFTKYTPMELANKIANEMPLAKDAIPNSAKHLTGDCTNLFASGNWDWFIEQLGEEITTEGLTYTDRMFNESKVKSIPFDLNCANGCLVSQTFQNCRNLEHLPNITGRELKNFYQFIGGCNRIREIPEQWATGIDWDYINTNTEWFWTRIAEFFRDCYSLRSIPKVLIKRLYPGSNNSNASGYIFYSCASLEEIEGFRGPNVTLSDNCLNNFGNCYRLGRLIFDYEDEATNTPRTQNWKGQTIDLSFGVGYSPGERNYILDYNSGITADKEVKDDATYQALKNDPDWFTCNVAYSRYNHDSAVETINSLPDTSDYLAANGGTNTIKFKGAAGSATDGGAINTLTEAEIAVAAAKGWTVSLV